MRIRQAWGAVYGHSGAVYVIVVAANLMTRRIASHAYHVRACVRAALAQSQAAGHSQAQAKEPLESRGSRFSWGSAPRYHKPPKD